MTIYTLSETDSDVYVTSPYYWPDIELETLTQVHQARLDGLVEVQTADGHTAFFVLDGTLLEL
jgi:hypothetical protein